DYIVNSLHILTLYDSELKQPVDINIQNYLKSDRKRYLHNYTNPVSIGNKRSLELLSEYISFAGSRITDKGLLILDDNYYDHIVSLSMENGFSPFIDENNILILTGDLFQLFKGLVFDPKYVDIQVEY